MASHRIRRLQLRKEDGSEDVYHTALTDEQGNFLLRDLKIYKKMLRYDDPMRRTINLRLQVDELLKRTGVRISADGEGLVGPQEGIEEVLRWFGNNNYA